MTATELNSIAMHGNRPYHSAHPVGLDSSLLLILGTVALVLFGVACGDKVTATPKPQEFTWPSGPTPSTVLHIEGMGVIEIELYPSLAPKNVENFLKLASQGFYDGTTFHRVIPGFMIQGGDPNSKDKNPNSDGHGGPGYKVIDEFSNAPHARGAVSMANVGRPNTGGSQFFIVHADSRGLDGKHTIFGRVSAGMEIVDAITAVEVDVHGRWGAKNRPIANIVIEKVEVRPTS